MSPNDSRERTPLLESAGAVGHHAGVMGRRAGSQVKSTWANFVNWIFQDNVIEVAIGLMYGWLPGGFFDPSRPDTDRDLELRMRFRM
jgi:hypothetical protein